MGGRLPQGPGYASSGVPSGGLWNVVLERVFFGMGAKGGKGLLSFMPNMEVWRVKLNGKKWAIQAIFEAAALIFAAV
eukprot:1393546-Amorphochlora_amoeboformis.AAC.1